MDQPQRPALAIAVEASFSPEGIRLRLTLRGLSAKVVTVTHHAHPIVLKAFTDLMELMGTNSTELQQWSSALRTYLDELAAYHVSEAFAAQLSQRNLPSP